MGEEKAPALIVPEIVSFTHYPFGFLRQPTDRPSHLLDVHGSITYQDRSHEYRWVVEGDEKAGLPIGAENDLEAFVHIQSAISNNNDSFEVSKKDILKRLGYPNNGRHHHLINNAITKFRKIQVTAINCLMDPRRGQFYRALNFPFFDSVGIICRGDNVTEIDMNAPVDIVLQQLSEVKGAGFVFSLSEPLRRLLKASNTIPLDWDLYISLPDIKTRMLYRTLNKMRHFNITYISLKELAKLLCLTHNRPAKIRNSLNPSFQLLQKRGVISRFQFNENIGVEFSFQQSPSIVHPRDEIQKSPLYQYLVNKTRVHPNAARACVESLYWRSEDKPLVIKFYELQRQHRGWNDGMLVLLLKGDDRIRDELLEVRQWIDQQHEQHQQTTENTEEDDRLNRVGEMLDQLTEEELEVLCKWVLEHAEPFSRQLLQRKLEEVEQISEILTSPIIRGSLLKALEEQSPERFQDDKGES